MLAQDFSSYEWPDHCKGEKTQYSHLAPEFTSDPEKINQPLGIKKARKIAFELGIKKSMLFTRQEYREFIGTRASRKMNPNQALIYNCVQVLTNSSANPIKVDIDGDEALRPIGFVAMATKLCILCGFPDGNSSSSRQENPRLHIT